MKSKKNKPNQFLIKAVELITLFKKDDELWLTEQEIKADREELRRQIKAKLERICQSK